jgi:hypothetical protein
MGFLTMIIPESATKSNIKNIAYLSLNIITQKPGNRRNNTRGYVPEVGRGFAKEP